MKPVSVEEAIARIEKDIEENRIEPNPDSLSVAGIRAVPTANPVNPIGLTTLQSTETPHDFIDPPYPDTPESAEQPYRHTWVDSTRLLSTEELIAELEKPQETLCQEYVEEYTHQNGEPTPEMYETLRRLALSNYIRNQIRLKVLQYFQNRPPTEMCPVERSQLDRYGEFFEVSREEGETDEAYRERIRQRGYPHLS